MARPRRLGRGDELVPNDDKNAFVSYSRTDSAFVESLLADLERAELDLWVDRHAILASEDWKSRLLNGILHSDSLLFVVSPAAVASEHCRWELEQAEALHKRIIPVRHLATPRHDIPRLLAERQWVDSDPLAVVEAVRTDPVRLRAHSRLLVQTADWDTERRSSLLLRGKELDAARQWLESGGDTMEAQPTALQRDFVAAGVRSSRRRRAAAVTAAALTAVATVLFVGFQVQAGRADTSRRLAQVAVEQRADHLDIALLVARAAAQQSDTPEARSALLGAVRTNPRLRSFLPPATAHQVGFGQETSFTDLVPSPDGAIFAVARHDGPNAPQVDLMRTVDGRAVGPPLTPGGTGLTYNAEGTLLAVRAGSTITVLDVAGHRTADTFKVPSPGPPADTDVFSDPTVPTAAGFVTTGRLVVAGPDSALRYRDVRAGRWDPPVPTGHTGAVRAVAVSPDRNVLATGGDDGRILLHNAADGRLLPGPEPSALDSGVRSLTFDRTGRLLVAGTADGRVIILAAATWQPVTDAFGDHQKQKVDAVAFSPDGAFLVSSGEDGTATVRRTSDWQPTGAALGGPGIDATGIAFGPDHNTLIWGVRTDDAVTEWDLDGLGPLAGSPTGPADVGAVAIRPSDGAIVTADPDGTVIALGHRFLHPTRDHLPVAAVAWSGDTVVSAAEDGSVRSWTPTSGTPPTAHEFGANATAVAIDPGGTLVAAATYPRRVQVRVLATWALVADVPAPESNVVSLALSRDGTLLAAGTETGGVLLLSLGADRALVALPGGHTDRVGGLALSHDQSRLASVSDDGTIIIWDVARRTQATQSLDSHAGQLRSVAFSPDATMVAVGADQEQVVLFDIAGRRQFGVPLRSWPFTEDVCASSPCMPVQAIAFTPSGDAVAAGTIDQGVVLWSMNPADWAREACRRAGRDLTIDEVRRWDVPAVSPCL